VFALILVLGLACEFGRGSVVGELGAVAAVLILPGTGWWLWRWSTGRRCNAVDPLLASFAWSTLVGCVCAWTTIIQPVILFAAITAPAYFAAITALIRSTQRRPKASGIIVPRPLNVRNWKLRRTDWLALGLVALSVVGFGLAISSARTAHIGAWGLIPALGIPFVVAVLASVALVALGLVGPRRWIIIAGLALVTFAFAGVPCLVTSNFIGGWDYKHLGVVDLISIGHSLSDTKDLYQQWPGFFSVAADVERLSGNASLHYANWASPLFLGVVGYAAFYAALRLNPGRWDIAAGASCLVLVTGWASQFYFAPQSLAFAIEMLILAGLVDRLPIDWRRRRHRGTAPATGVDESSPPDARPLDRGWVALQGGAFVAIVLTHQLTPFILLAQLVPFVFARSATRSMRTGLIAAVVFTLAYLLAHLPVLEVNSIFNTFSATTLTGSAITAPSVYQVRAADGAHIVVAFVWGGAALCVLRLWRRWRRSQRYAAPTVLAVMPIWMLVIGNYGGEAIYRVWLFSSPWCALIIATACCDFVRFRRVTQRVAPVAGALVCAGCFFASAQATDFGMWKMLAVPNSDIAASTWLLKHAPAGTATVVALTNFPGRLSWQYTLHNRPPTVNDPSLTDEPQFEGNGLATYTATALATHMRAEYGPHPYLIVSKSMEAEAQYYGTVTPTALSVLTSHLLHSSAWKVPYRSDHVIIFQVAR
jgi:hypothetical protein